MNLRTERHTRPRLVGGTAQGSLQVTDEEGCQRTLGVTCTWLYRPCDLGTSRSHVDFVVHVEHPYGGWRNIGNDIALELRNAILPTYQEAMRAAGASIVTRKIRLRRHLESCLIKPTRDPAISLAVR